MLSRRSFLIGINSVALAPCTLGVSWSQPALFAISSPKASQQAEDLLSIPQANTQFKIYGWNASDADEKDSSTTVIHLSNLWRSGWL